MEKPYRVELDDPGCKECAAGRMWVVVGPDGIAGSTSYSDQGAAEEIAELQNEAFEQAKAHN